MIRKHFEIEETAVTIIAEKSSYVKIAENEIKKIRKKILDFIKKDNFFKITYEPYFVDDADDIIKEMCRSSNEFNIGPMSTVAGIIAEYSVKAMINAGANYAIVDNGGDIAIFTDRKVYVGVYSRNKFFDKVVFQINPSDKIIGVCTSSGKFGHSLSFGNSDAVTIFSFNVAVADAAATAVGNLIGDLSDIKNAFRILDGKKRIEGAVAFIDDLVGIWGNIPSIITADFSSDLITRGVGL